MDDILIASQHQAKLGIILLHMIPSLESCGLQIASEKIQKMAPWKYFRWFISVCPQSLKLVPSVKTLHDLKKLLDTIN